MNCIAERIEKLRWKMRREGIDFFLIGSSDYHVSEYMGDYFRVSWYFSGCTSDNVRLVIGRDSAKLWTDGRYFISAALELEETEIELMKSGEAGVPGVEEYLSGVIRSGMTLAFDGMTVNYREGLRYRDIVLGAGGHLVCDIDPADGIWTDRPALRKNKAVLLPDDLAGETAESRIAGVREEMGKSGADACMISKLDDIGWLLNMRGSDVDYNPVALAHCFITQDEVILFLQDEARTKETDRALGQNNVTIRPYESLMTYLETSDVHGICLLDPGAVSYRIADTISGRMKTVLTDNPTERLKAVKNPVEIAHIRECYLKDSVALCRFLCWFDRNAGRREITEASAAAYLDSLRAGIPGFLDCSFPTISAYGANAAMAHYSASEEGCAKVEPRGFYLVDSGGQYLGGTTDVTRTLKAGELTDEERRDFTLVAAANLNLMYARFRYGTTGRLLDAYARAPIWEYGMDYNHGTGHGIGYMLNVHEGPQNISWKYAKGRNEAVFEPGMLVSDEPGIYVEGKYGIRTENILLTVEDVTNEFGRFLRFEPLTYAPIDLGAIDTAYMQPKDIRRLNDYHALVRAKIAPYLKGEELAWLIEATGKL